VSLKGNNQAALSARLLKDEKELPRHHVFVQNPMGEVEVRAICPEPGDYTLRLFAKPRGRQGAYLHIMDYTVQAAAGVDGKIGFPETYEAFKQTRTKLYAPMNRFLKAGTQQNFKIRVPDASAVSVVSGKKWTSLRRGLTFEGRVKIQKGENAVVAKFPGGGKPKQFTVLVTYVGY
jgi:hypothetical protein